MRAHRKPQCKSEVSRAVAALHLAWGYPCPESLALLTLTFWLPGCLGEHVEDPGGKSCISHLNRDWGCP